MSAIDVSLQMERQLGALALHFLDIGRPDLAAWCWSMQEIS